MSKPYFRYIPEFDYISRESNSKNISDYIRVKNIFKKAEINQDIFNDLSNFTKYKIVGDERPDNIAYKVYNDQNLDWLILLSNNILNVESEWPLSQESFHNYLMTKYNTEENIYGVHHYETIQILNSEGKIIIKKGLEVPKDFSITYYDNGIEMIATNCTVGITNYQYETKINEDKRNIYILKSKYINTVINDMESIMSYKKGSSQYVSKNLVKGSNTRIYN